MARWLTGIGAALAATLMLSSGGAAQDYPNRAVKIIVPFPPGGTADAMPRIVADWLSRKWKQGVVIENRAGAGGNVGAEAAYKSDPDGYTLFSAPPPPLVYNHVLNPKLNFDPTQFIPIAVMGKVPNSLLTNSPRLKDAKTVADVIAYAKANPGALNSATQGVGTTAHLTSELFAQMAGVKFQHIHYRGSAPAVQDLVAGNVDIAFDNIGAAMSLIKGGKIRLLARGDRQADALDAGRADHRRDRAGLRGGDLVCDRRAAEDAAGDRRQAQRRHQRGAARSGRQEAPGKPVGRGRGRLAAGDRRLLQG